MRAVPTSERTRGTLFAAVAYVLWGVIPLYFLLLAPMAADEIVGWRVLFSLVLCLILVTVTRGWTRLFSLLRKPRVVALTAVAGVIIYANWYLFTVAATGGAVLEASLGYFITPIVSVALGVVFFAERLRPLQWIAFALSALAVVVLSVLYGVVPWMALAMAITFGLYGFVKKLIGSREQVDAISGLTLETALVVPIAVAQLIIIAATRGLQFGTLGAANTTLVAFAGFATAVPLLLFAAGTQRVPLVVLGMLQFIEPMIQFATGALLGEPMPPERLLGFGIVWIAIVLLVIDSLRAVRSRRRDERDPAEIPSLQTGPLPVITGGIAVSDPPKRRR